MPVHEDSSADAKSNEDSVDELSITSVIKDELKTIEENNDAYEGKHHRKGSLLTRKKLLAAADLKCKLVASLDYDAQYDQGRQPAKVEVFLKNGRVLEEEATDVPWLTEPQIVCRFVDELAPVTSVDSAQRILKDCQHLERLQDCRSLFEV